MKPKRKEAQQATAVERGSVWITVFAALGIFSAEARAASQAEFFGPLTPVQLEAQLVPSEEPRSEVQLRILGTDWDSVIDQAGGEKVEFGVNLHGPSPYTRNHDLAFIPASNTKIFTTAAALDLLGPDYRYETRLTWRRVAPDSPAQITELTLHASGDPSWGMKEFGEDVWTRIRRFAADLKAQGVREIRGPIRVVSEDPRWEKWQFPPGWQDEDFWECYGALPRPVNLQVNCAIFVVSGRTSGAWQEAGVPTPVKVSLKKGSKTQLSVRVVGAPDNPRASFVIEGTWAAGTPPQKIVFPIHDTGHWFLNLFTQALKTEGIRRVAKVKRGQDRMLQELRYLSPTLGEILVPFMKSSINVVGEAIFLTLGQKFGAPDADLLSGGQSVMRAFVSQIGTLAAERAGVPAEPGYFAEEAVFWDGSGVSRENRVSTNTVMALLLDLRASPLFGHFWESLPIAGVDGTLASRMKGTAAEGVLRAKTGTLTGVYNLSGFVPRWGTEGQVLEFVPFVMLSRTSAENRVAARAAQDRVGAKLVEVVNPQLYPEGGAGR